MKFEYKKVEMMCRVAVCDCGGQLAFIEGPGFFKSTSTYRCLDCNKIHLSDKATKCLVYHPAPSMPPDLSI